MNSLQFYITKRHDLEIKSRTDKLMKIWVKIFIFLLLIAYIHRRS